MCSGAIWKFNMESTFNKHFFFPPFWYEGFLLKWTHLCKLQAGLFGAWLFHTFEGKQAGLYGVSYQVAFFDTEYTQLSTFSKGNHMSSVSRAKLHLTFHLKPETSWYYSRVWVVTVGGHSFHLNGCLFLPYLSRL